MRASVVAILVLMLACTHPARAQSAAAQMLVGKWSWTMPRSGCVETHEYRPDGTRYVVSGEEHSDTRYSVAGPTSKGFMKLTVTTVKDHGGVDCGQGNEDDSGRTSTVFFKVHRTGNAVLFCYEESLEKCYGPFMRVP